MKRLAIAITIAFIVSFVAFSQTPEDELIPRRVYFAVDEETPTIAAEILYSALSDYQALVLVDDKDDAHNRIELASEEQKIRFSLFSGESLRDEITIEVSSPAILPEASAQVAERWSPYLEMTEPYQDKTVMVERQQILEEISFNQSITLPNQLNLWLPVSLRIAVSSDSTVILWQGPFTVEYDWFPGESIGIITSLQVDSGDKLSYASNADNPVPTDYLKILPGVGIVFRSIGRLSAEFGLKFSFGVISITPEGTSDKPVLAAGENGWYFYPSMELFMNINWNFSEHWSMKGQFLNLDMCLYSFGDSNAPFETDQGILFTFLKLGAAYRW